MLETKEFILSYTYNFIHVAEKGRSKETNQLKLLYYIIKVFIYLMRWFILEEFAVRKTILQARAYNTFTYSNSFFPTYLAASFMWIRIHNKPVSIILPDIFVSCSSNVLVNTILGTVDIAFVSFLRTAYRHNS